MNPLFLLTRLEPTDDGLCAKASELGFTVLRVPLIATELGMDSPTVARKVASVGDGIAMAWTSRRAAEALARVLPGARANLGRVPMYCVGEESAAPVRRAGFEPRIPPESTGAAGLARYILQRAEQDQVKSVIFLRGDRSLPDLPNLLQEGGLEVYGLEVYRTRFLEADVSGLAGWLKRGEPVAVAFFSPSGIQALERLLDPDMRTRLHEHATAVARGETTARALKERGYGRIVQPGTVDSFETVAHEALRTISTRITQP